MASFYAPVKIHADQTFRGLWVSCLRHEQEAAPIGQSTLAAGKPTA